MLDNNLIQSTSSWPFVEIRKLLKDRKDIIKTKNKITFQTGYGPSGLPHIGTFGEVARTSMMINALKHIQKIEYELITFTDDMDGTRKVPENISHDKGLKENLGTPLTNIPDPFRKNRSFDEHNISIFNDSYKKFNFNHFYSIERSSFLEGVIIECAIRIATTKIARSYLPDYVATMFKVMLTNASFAGVVSEIPQGSATIQCGDRCCAE